MPKRPKVKRDITLLIFEKIGWVARLPVNAFKNFKRTRRYREISLAVFGLFVIVASIFAISSAFAPNALSVYVGDQNLGIVRWEVGEIDISYIETHTMTRLQSQFATEIYPLQDITARPVRAGRNAETVSFGTMITAVENALEFYVYASVISVNGSEAVALPNFAAAMALLDGIIYTHANGSSAHYDFAQNVIVNTVRTHKNDLHSHAQALNILTAPRITHEVHIVGSGDRLYNIARSNGMSLSALLALNPNIDPDALLREGTAILVTPNVPILTVRSIN